MQHDLISLNEAAGLLGLAPKTLYNWKLDDKLPFPYYKIGNRVKFKLSDIESYIEANKVPTVASIKSAINEVSRMRAGKVKAQTLSDFINEI